MIPQTPWLPRIAVTAGDPRGVGLELLLQSLTAERASAHWTIIAPRQLLEQNLKQAELEFPQIPSFSEADRSACGVSLLSVAEDVKFPPDAVPDEQTSAWVALASLNSAVDHAYRGDFDGLVTAPVSKSAIAKILHHFAGQTGYIAERCATPSTTMLFWRPELALALATQHLPLSQVSSAITIDLVVETTRALCQLLQTLGKESPRLAILALNPHAGESGLLGKEEQEIISPAINTLQGEGINVTGPFPADSFLAHLKPGEYDGITAMYHDQGLIFFKRLGPGVNLTWGLPFVRTSPDHGPAFELAGSGRADPTSSRMALQLAVHLVKLNRGKK
jgi:4-hydroxythreonine-4-phosphate dehydrogenase